MYRMLWTVSYQSTPNTEKFRLVLVIEIHYNSVSEIKKGDSGGGTYLPCVLIVGKSEPQPNSVISCIVLEKACVHQANALSMPALVANTWYAVDVRVYGSCLYVRNESK